MPNKGDIERLRPWVEEPYREEQVLAACKRLPQPFLLREVVAESRLPVWLVQNPLTRMVKKGILTRRKVPMSYPHYTGGQGGRRGRCRMIPGGRQRRVYIYSFPMSDDE